MFFSESCARWDPAAQKSLSSRRAIRLTENSPPPCPCCLVPACRAPAARRPRPAGPVPEPARAPPPPVRGPGPARAAGAARGQREILFHARSEAQGPEGGRRRFSAPLEPLVPRSPRAAHARQPRRRPQARQRSGRCVPRRGRAPEAEAAAPRWRRGRRLAFPLPPGAGGGWCVPRQRPMDRHKVKRQRLDRICEGEAGRAPLGSGAASSQARQRARARRDPALPSRAERGGPAAPGPAAGEARPSAAAAGAPVPRPVGAASQSPGDARLAPGELTGSARLRRKQSVPWHAEMGAG